MNNLEETNQRCTDPSNNRDDPTLELLVNVPSTTSNTITPSSSSIADLPTSDSGDLVGQVDQSLRGSLGKPCNFFHKSTKNKNIRKRRTQNSDNDDDDKDQDQPSIQKPRKYIAEPDNKLRFSTLPPQRKPLQQDASDEDNIHRPGAFHFESSREIQVQNDNKATSTLETETQFDRDHRAIRERMLKKAEEALNKGVSTSSSKDGKEYKGIHGYTDYKAGFRREQTVAGEKAGGAHGPLRASQHIRASVRFDYQPDICKDYKETGYCGFGDACKFMHDRGDYKSGWQMEKEWEESEKIRKRGLAMGGGGDSDEEDDEDDDELPFACFICRQPFEDPVVTNCKHYFCEHCALKHHTKNKKCFVCNKPTLGIFNTAHDIRKRIAEKK